MVGCMLRQYHQLQEGIAHIAQGHCLGFREGDFTQKKSLSFERDFVIREGKGRGRGSGGKV